MKKIFTLLVVAVLCVAATACHKQSGPQPPPPSAPASTNSPDLTTDAGLSAFLVGTWTLDSICEYSNNVWQYRYGYPQKEIIFTSTPYDNSGNDTKQCSYGTPGSAYTSGSWRMDTTLFKATGSHYINGGIFPGYIHTIVLTGHMVTCQNNTASVKQGTYQFYSKKP